MVKSQTINMADVLRQDVFLRAHGLSVTLPIVDSNHHYAHALSAFFYTDWDNALMYTADGVYSKVDINGDI